MIMRVWQSPDPPVRYTTCPFAGLKVPVRYTIGALVGVRAR